MEVKGYQMVLSKVKEIIKQSEGNSCHFAEKIVSFWLNFNIFINFTHHEVLEQDIMRNTFLNYVCFKLNSIYLISIISFMLIVM